MFQLRTGRRGAGESVACSRVAAVFVLAVLAVALGSVACSPAAESPGGPGEAGAADAAPAAAVAVADPVARGQYLVTVLACNDCHTPFVMGPEGPQPDMARMLSGHPEAVVLDPLPALAGTWTWAGAATNTAFAGPWGVSFAFNLTPDENTGLGIWTEEMFIAALRTGKHMGQARPIAPPMPWPAYGQLTDDDLKAVFAYLRTIPPVVNRVPEYQPPAAPPAQPAS
jgi:mono/diheme cytochrome c family protein